MFSKSEVAFLLSCEKLFEEEKEVYFWTFTFVKVMPDWWISRTFGEFMRALRDIYKDGIRGVKVIELHQTHGVHYHALLNKRIYAGMVRRVGRRYGSGRVHVKRANKGAVGYMVKYLSKQFRKENKFFSGAARWGTIGTFRGVKVGDIELENNYTRAVHLIRMATGSKPSWDVLVAFKGCPTWDQRLLGRCIRAYQDGLGVGAFAAKSSDVEPL